MITSGPGVAPEWARIEDVYDNGREWEEELGSSDKSENIVKRKTSVYNTMKKLSEEDEELMEYF